ncbi:unnamed protein product [Auanema sp. JU1783]|nr:unnamed protein product [Auanema sp. JU1783]
MSSTLCRFLVLFMLLNVVLAHYYWFETPGTLKFNDEADMPMNDEPLQMQKRFRVKYLRNMNRLNPGNF